MTTQAPVLKLADIVLEPGLYRTARVWQDGPDRLIANIGSHDIRWIRRLRGWSVIVDIVVYSHHHGTSVPVALNRSPDPAILRIWTALATQAARQLADSQARILPEFFGAAARIYRSNEADHEHVTTCYDDPGPGHGPPALICDHEDAPR